MSEPKKLGKYEIRGELGQGAMGIVYDGFDPMIGRRVALKTVRREQLDRAEVEVALEREGRRTRELRSLQQTTQRVGSAGNGLELETIGIGQHGNRPYCRTR